MYIHVICAKMFFSFGVMSCLSDLALHFLELFFFISDEWLLKQD